MLDNTASSALDRARARLNAMRAAGEKAERVDPIEKAARNPKSKALALRAYWWRWVGCSANAVTKEMRAEYATRVRDGRGKIAATIKAICFECVGEDADPGPKQRVRDCEIMKCPLRPVRPWQDVKSRTGKNGGPRVQEERSGAGTDRTSSATI